MKFSMKFRAMKFRVNNPEHSKRVQRVLFDMGYRWIDGTTVVKLTDRPYLYADEDGDLAFGVAPSLFSLREITEIDVSWLDPGEETIEIEGRAYRKADVIDRLAELEPLG